MKNGRHVGIWLTISCQNVPDDGIFNLKSHIQHCIVSDIAGLAQLVEHLICNQRVVGSSPTTGTRISAGFPRIFIFVHCAHFDVCSRCVDKFVHFMGKRILLLFPAICGIIFVMNKGDICRRFLLPRRQYGQQRTIFVKEKRAQRYDKR